MKYLMLIPVVFAYAMVCCFPSGTYTVSGTVKAWSLLRVGGEWQNGRITRVEIRTAPLYRTTPKGPAFYLRESTKTR
ncbi:MAG: hypothetical protein JJU29_09560 [Verrucomicrobia bacterium]|nr:hypothetical protein [Verrucomicrobiota bacterium]MCH8513098.1 hypothetical protein [Kiritimatiellia bacterium]